MKLLFYVLSKTEKLDELLNELTLQNLCGATILDSVGMARLLYDKKREDSVPILGSLRSFLNPEREKSKVIFMIVKESQVATIIDIIESVVGDIEKKNNGIIFTLPVDFAKGICNLGD